MQILGIETSCDETAAAVVTDTREIRSNVVLSQIDHAAFGGVVPEIAARAHLDHLDPVIRQALDQAHTSINDIDAIAVTAGPGLIGGVIVGVMTAKGLAFGAQKPLIAVNHLEGHALSARLADPDLDYPYLLVLVTGGHCQILSVTGVNDYVCHGTTLDDAVGECFDKSAKLMGLGYPGGAQIERCAACAQNPERFDLPLSMVGRPGCDFSFSGLKTAVRRHIEHLDPLTEHDIADLSAALQTTIAKILSDRVDSCLSNLTTKPGALVVAGGVAANTEIRHTLEKLSTAHHLKFSAPPLDLCSDNAAMIAWAGVEHFKAGRVNDLTFPARPRWPLESLGQ